MTKKCDRKKENSEIGKKVLTDGLDHNKCGLAVIF